MQANSSAVVKEPAKIMRYTFSDLLVNSQGRVIACSCSKSNSKQCECTDTTFLHHKFCGFVSNTVYENIHRLKNLTQSIK
jgi:hypothetical protein